MRSAIQLYAEAADSLLLMARKTRLPALTTLASRVAIRSISGMDSEQFKLWLARRLSKAGSGAAKRSAPTDEQLREALSDLYRISEANGLKVFIMFGTLLGAIRNGTFIPGDIDIDTGIIGQSDFLNLGELLKRSGFSVNFNSRKSSKIGLRHRNGAQIDVKLFVPDGGGNWTWTSHFDHYAFKNSSPLIAPLDRQEFLGIGVWMPQKAQEFLAWHYGPGWKQPTSNYHYLVGRESDDPAHNDFIVRAAPYVAYKALRNGKLKSAHVIAERLSGLVPDDSLWPAFQRLLDRG